METIGAIASIVGAIIAVIDLVIRIVRYVKQKSNRPDQG